MKLKDGFILRTISGQTVVVPTEGDLNLNMMIKLNGTGRFLWEHLQTEITEEELLAAVLKEYDVAEADARKYIGQFVQDLKNHGFIC